MNKKLLTQVLFSFALLFNFTIAVFAQAPTGFLTGRITERITGQPIANAKISIEGQAEAQTDAEGKYSIELTPGTYRGRVTANGFAPALLSSIVITAKYTLVYDLKLEVQVTEETTVNSGYYATSSDQPVSSIALRRAEIRAMPGTGGDVMRVIGTLPGVTSVGMQFADFLVRGGMPGENLTFIDNIPVGDFTYFNDQYDGGKGGRGAVLAPDVFDRLEFSAGGFGARYGDKMSSALDVTIRNANRKRVQGSIFADSGVAGASVEVPLGERAGWFFSARRSYIDFALDLFDIGDIGKPRNLDFINKFDFDLNARNKLTFTAMNFNDRATIPYETAIKAATRRDQLVAERSSKRFIFGATLSSALGTKAFSNLTAWGIGEHNDGSFLRLDRKTLQRQRDLREANFGVKEELTASLSPRLNFAGGGGVNVQRGNFYTFERNGEGYSLLLDEILAPTRTSNFRLGNTTNAYAYGQLTWQINSQFSVTPGVRLDRYGLTSQTLVSPRVSARYRLASRLALNFASGIYRQPPTTFLYSLSANNRTLEAQRAVHIIGGVEWLASESVRVTIEAYQKKYRSLHLQPNKLTADYVDTGEGYARGVEISAQKALSGHWSGQAAYSYSVSKVRFTPNNLFFPSDVVRPHQLTLIGMTSWKGLLVASKMRVASGLPYSKLSVFTLTRQPPINSWVLMGEENRNALRLPKYFQLDLRVEKKFDFKGWSFAPYADFFNLTRYKNITEATYRNFSGPSFLNERKIIPIIGARVEF